MRRAPEIVRIGPRWAESLARFFEALTSSGEAEYFRPHPFTREEANSRAHYRGNDLYYLLIEDAVVVGYGLLRGWDEGYEVPSLGIAIHPAARGMGLGCALMHFLHAVARRKGASRIRLKVHRENMHALRLYRKLGYVFQEEEEDGQLVGFLDLV